MDPSLHQRVRTVDGWSRVKSRWVVCSNRGRGSPRANAPPQGRAVRSRLQWRVNGPWRSHWPWSGAEAGGSQALRRNRFGSRDEPTEARAGCRGRCDTGGPLTGQGRAGTRGGGASAGHADTEVGRRGRTTAELRADRSPGRPVGRRKRPRTSLAVTASGGLTAAGTAGESGRVGADSRTRWLAEAAPDRGFGARYCS